MPSNIIVSLGVAFLLAGVAFAQGPDVKALTASLIANKDTYTLDSAYAGQAFRDKVEAIQKAGQRLPDAQAIDFTLRITNNTGAAMTIKVGGDESRIELKLAGNGALNLDNPVAMTMEYRMGKPTVIAPGKSLDLPITSLMSGTRGISRVAYFTEPGAHTLSATFTTQKEGEEVQTTLTTEPVKFTVAAAK